MNRTWKISQYCENPQKYDLSNYQDACGSYTEGEVSVMTVCAGASSGMHSHIGASCIAEFSAKYFAEHFDSLYNAEFNTACAELTNYHQEMIGHLARVAFERKNVQILVGRTIQMKELNKFATAVQIFAVKGDKAIYFKVGNGSAVVASGKSLQTLSDSVIQPPEVSITTPNPIFVLINCDFKTFTISPSCNALALATDGVEFDGGLFFEHNATPFYQKLLEDICDFENDPEDELRKAIVALLNDNMNTEKDNIGISIMYREPLAEIEEISETEEGFEGEQIPLVEIEDIDDISEQEIIIEDESEETTEEVIVEDEPDEVVEEVIIEDEPEEVVEEVIIEDEPEEVIEEVIIEDEPEEAIEKVIIEDEPEEAIEEVIVEEEPEEAIEEVIIEDEPEDVVEEVIIEEEPEEVVEEVIIEEELEEVVEEVIVEDEPEEAIEEVIIEDEPEEVVEEVIVEDEPEEVVEEVIIEDEPDEVVEEVIIEDEPEEVVEEVIIEEEPEEVIEEVIVEDEPEEVVEEVIIEEEPEEAIEEVIIEEKSEEKTEDSSKNDTVKTDVAPKEAPSKKQQKKSAHFFKLFNISITKK